MPILNQRTINSVNVGSDHKLLIGKILIDIPSLTRKLQPQSSNLTSYKDNYIETR